jgi:hypothetical protein
MIMMMIVCLQLNSGGTVELEDYPFRDDEVMDIEEAGDKHTGTGRGLSMAEQVDEIIDHSIEIESNKRMRNANLNTWTLRFNDVATENKVRHGRYGMAGTAWQVWLCWCCTECR